MLSDRLLLLRADLLAELAADVRGVGRKLVGSRRWNGREAGGALYVSEASPGLLRPAG